MLSLTDIPQSIDCYVNGHRIIKDLSLPERFEVLVAQVLQGRWAANLNSGFDVYDSKLHPRFTFQVKVSKAWFDPGRDARKRNRAEIYTFNGSIEHIADYYILFGIREELVYPFLLSRSLWEQHGSKAGNGRRVLIISAERYTRKTKALKQNRLWNCFIADWPDTLHRWLRQRQPFLLKSIPATL
jgi:hypothetical protein